MLARWSVSLTLQTIHVQQCLVQQQLLGEGDGGKQRWQELELRRLVACKRGSRCFACAWISYMTAGCPASIALSSWPRMTQEKGDPPAHLCSTTIPHSQVATPLRTPELQIQPLDFISTLSDTDQGDVDLTCSRCAEEVEMEVDVSFFPSAFATFSSFTPFTDTVFTDGSLLSLTSLLEAGNTRGYLMDLSLDDIFEDIDTSMFDSSEGASIMTCVLQCEPRAWWG